MSYILCYALFVLAVVITGYDYEAATVIALGGCFIFESLLWIFKPLRKESLPWKIPKFSLVCNGIKNGIRKAFTACTLAVLFLFSFNLANKVTEVKEQQGLTPETTRTLLFIGVVVLLLLVISQIYLRKKPTTNSWWIFPRNGYQYKLSVSSVSKKGVIMGKLSLVKGENVWGETAELRSESPCTVELKTKYAKSLDEIKAGDRILISCDSSGIIHCKKQ